MNEVNNNQIEEALQLITSFLQQVTVNDLCELTTVTTATVHHIKVKQGTEPIKQKQRRIMYHFKKDFDKVLEDMI
jgi:hypothetical protein